LNLNNTKITDVFAVANLSSLTSLDLSWCKNITDVFALSSLSSLTSLTYLVLMNWKQIKWQKSIQEEIKKNIKVNSLVKIFWNKNKIKKRMWNILDSNLSNILNNKKTLNTFKSMFNLSDDFWWDYKLGAKEYKLFTKWIENNIFDTSSSTFHKYTNQYNDYTTLATNHTSTKKHTHTIWKTLVFEVDGTWFIDDQRFDSIQTFFVWLANQK
jgi:hypothetical protein